MDHRFRLHFRRDAGHGPYGHNDRRRCSRPHGRFHKRGLAVARAVQTWPKAWLARDDARLDGELSSALRLQWASARDCSVLGSEEVAITEPETNQQSTRLASVVGFAASSPRAAKTATGRHAKFATSASCRWLAFGTGRWTPVLPTAVKDSFQTCSGLPPRTVVSVRYLQPLIFVA